MDTQNALIPAPTRLQSLALRETPAYRVAKFGNQGCTTTELFAAVIGGAQQIETAETLLAHYRGNIQSIYKAHPDELAKIHGIGQQTAIRLKAALALAMRLHEPTEEKPSINSPADAAELVQYEMSLLEAEELRVLLLDTRNQLLEIVKIYTGSVNSSQIHIGEVFRPAIRKQSPAIIVVHNHPSGDPTPSPDDVAVTRAMVQAGRLLDIEVLDHMVIGSNRWVSLKERGLGFN
jgi:DNA repair protein RadC